MQACYEEFLRKGFVSPNDPGVMGEDDSTSIQNAINLALESGVGRVEIPRYNQRTGQLQSQNCQSSIEIPAGLQCDPVTGTDAVSNQRSGSSFRSVKDFCYGHSALGAEQQNFIRVRCGQFYEK